MTRSREEMIFDLTRFELVWLQDEGWALCDVAEFFARGGFSVWSDDDLAEKWENTLARNRETLCHAEYLT